MLLTWQAKSKGSQEILPHLSPPPNVHSFSNWVLTQNSTTHLQPSKCNKTKINKSSLPPSLAPISDSPHLESSSFTRSIVHSIGTICTTRSWIIRTLIWVHPTLWMDVGMLHVIGVACHSSYNPMRPLRMICCNIDQFACLFCKDVWMCLGECSILACTNKNPLSPVVGILPYCCKRHEVKGFWQMFVIRCYMYETPAFHIGLKKCFFW